MLKWIKTEFGEYRAEVAGYMIRGLEGHGDPGYHGWDLCLDGPRGRGVVSRCSTLEQAQAEAEGLHRAEIRRLLRGPITATRQPLERA